MEKSSDIIFSLSTDGLLVTLNLAFEDITGWQSQEWIGKPFVELFHPEDITIAQKLFSNVRMGSISSQICMRIRKITSDYVYCEFDAYPLHSNKGTIGILCTARDITERKKAEETLRESELKYRELTELISQVVFEIDLLGNLNFINQTGFELFGYTEEDLHAGINAFDLIDEEDRPCALINLALILQQQAPTKNEFIARRKDGTKFPFQIYSSIISCDGKPIGLRGIIVDITERKKVEQALIESELRYRELAKLLPQVVFEIDLFGNLNFVNQAAFELFGYTEEELHEGINVFDILAPEDRPIALENIALQLRQQVPTKNEYNAMKKDGTKFPFQIYSSIIYSDGKPIGLRGIIIDITERKKTEEALIESEKKYRELVELLPQVVFEIDLFGNLNFINLGAFEKFGYTVEDLNAGMNVFDILAPEDHPIVKENIMRLINKQLPSKNEYIAIKKDGTKFPIQIYAAIIYHNDYPVGIRGITIDITERKKAEEALKVSEELFRTVFYNTGTATVIFEENNLIIRANPEFEKLSKYSTKEIENKKPWTGFILKEDLEWMQERHLLRIAEQEPVLNQYEFRFITKDGDIRNILLTIALIKGTKRTVASLLDITDRKQAEEALKESEERYRSMVKILPDAVIITTDDKIVYANESACNILKAENPERLMGLTAIEFIPPELREMLLQTIEDSLTNNKIVKSIEFTLNALDGETVYLISSAIQFQYLGKQSLLSVSTDITERKKAEEALMEYEAKLANAADLAKLGPWEYDVEKDIFTFNDHFYKIFHTNVEREGGYTMSSSQYAQRFVYPEEVQAVGNEIRHAIETTDPNYSRQLEHRIIYADGGMGYINVRFGIIKDARGHTIKTYGVNQDITEQKLVEKALQKSEELYRKLLMTVPEVIVQTDIEGYINFVNETAFPSTGFVPKERITGKNMLSFISKKDLERAIENTKLMLEKPLGIQEYSMTFDEGIEIYCEVNGDVLRDAKGIPYGMVYVVRDITERMEAERALRESEAKYSAMIENISDVIQITGTDYIIRYKSQNIEKWFGWKPEELVGTCCWDYIHPDDVERIQKEFSILLEKDNSVKTVEFRYKCKDSSYKMIEQTGTNLVNDPIIQGILLNYHDITERKKAEEALRESEERYRLLIDNASFPIVVSTFESDLLYRNSKAEEFFGVDKNNIENLSTKSFWVNPENRDEYINKIKEKGFVQNAENHLYTKNKTIKTVLYSANVIDYYGKKAILTIFNDITELKEAESKVLEAENIMKETALFSSIGVWSEGIIHEISQPLYVVKLGIDGIIMWNKQQHDILPENISKMLQGVNRAIVSMSDIIKHMRSFLVDTGNKDYKLYNINEIISDTITPLKHKIAKHKINLLLELADIDEAVYVSKIEIQLIINNLINNSIFALDEDEDNSEKFIKIATFGNGDFVNLLVEDNGVGLPDVKEEELFSPLFSTRKGTAGTGLGLSIVKMFVTKFGGKITASRREEGGAIFTVTIPKVEQKQVKK
jgi:PAS domain S-box-containing protein